MYRMEPWGERRSDLAAATVASVVANVNRAKDAPAYSPLDFMHFEPKAEPAEMPPEEFLNRIHG